MMLDGNIEVVKCVLQVHAVNKSFSFQTDLSINQINVCCFVMCNTFFVLDYNDQAMNRFVEHQMFTSFKEFRGNCFSLINKLLT